MRPATEEETRDIRRLTHALQSAVAYEEGTNPKATTPKHLRTGINVALVEGGVIARILVEKGVITEKEYYSAIIAGLTREVAEYELRAAQHMGVPASAVKFC